MSASTNTLRFIWWNVQDFAHYDIGRASADRWPRSRDEYAEKRRRVERVLQLLSGNDPPELLAIAEITDQAARELRDNLFPDFEVFSIASLYIKPDFHVAVLYKPSAGLWKEDFLAATNVPGTTRPMAILDYRSTGHTIRFYLCHWTARFKESSEKWRQILALSLSDSIHKFLHPQEVTKETRHVVILGDLNEEPYGMLERWLYAHRHRAPSRQRVHPSDESIGRVRLYNCAWRLMGEHHPHPCPLGEREMAGSHYRRDERTWHTFDQVIVSGSLLGDSPPYLDERSLRLASWLDVLPNDLLGDDHLPHKFEWNSGHPIGVSDHIPLCGRIILG